MRLLLIEIEPSARPSASDTSQTVQPVYAIDGSTKKNPQIQESNTGGTASPEHNVQNDLVQGPSFTDIMPRAEGNINGKIKNGAALDGDGRVKESRISTGVSSAATVYNSIPQSSKSINLSMKK